MQIITFFSVLFSWRYYSLQDSFDASVLASVIIFILKLDPDLAQETQTITWATNC